MDIQEKILSYETFVNERLRTDLKKVLDQRDKIYEEISEYSQLKSTIEKLQTCNVKENLKTQMDIGCQFYVKAVVPNPTRICVKVGFGFFVEFTFSEALTFIDKKIQWLHRSSEQYAASACEIKAKIKVVLEGLRELQSLNRLPDSQSNVRDIMF